MRYSLLVLLVLIAGMDARADSAPNQEGVSVQTIEEVPKRVRDLIARVESDRDCCDAMSQLGDLGPEAVAAVPTLAKKLKDWNWTHRLSACAALYCIGPGAKTATAELVEALGDKQFDVACAAKVTLSKIGAPAVPAVVHALDNPSRITRRRAAQTLRLMGAAAKPALSALRRSLSDVEEDVRNCAQNAIREIQAQSCDVSSTKD